MNPRPLLRLEDKLAAEEVHLRALGRGHQRSRLAAAVVLSVAAHAAFLLVPAPQAAGIPPAPPRNAEFPRVVRWIPAPAAPTAAAAPSNVAALSAAPAPLAKASQPSAPAPAPPVLPARPDPAAAVTSEAPPGPPAGLGAFARAEPVAEPLRGFAVALPRGVETLIGPPSPPPPQVKAVISAGPPATRPIVALGGRVDPEYPPAARALRLTGSVTLDVEVNEDGTVGTVNVVGVSRRGVGFEAAAVAAVRQWRFVPGTQGGRPVAATTSVEVTFQ